MLDDFVNPGPLKPLKPTAEESAAAEEEATFGTATLASQGFMVSFTKQSLIRIAARSTSCRWSRTIRTSANS